MSRGPTQRNVDRRKWTAEEDEIVRAEYGVTLTAELARRLNRNSGAIWARAKRLGISVPPRSSAHTLQERGLCRIVPREADLAGAFLRAEVPVYRCDEVGRQDPHGCFMRYGNAVLTQEELIAKAKRKGWNPDGWRQVA